MCSDLLHLLKHAHLSPALPLLFTFCPPLRPHSLKIRWLYLFRAFSQSCDSLSVAPLALSAPVLLSLARFGQNLPLLLFHLYLLGLSSKFPSPFCFLFSITPPCEHLIIPYLHFLVSCPSLIAFLPPSNLALLLSLCISFYHLLT